METFASSKEVCEQFLLFLMSGDKNKVDTPLCIFNMILRERFVFEKLIKDLHNPGLNHFMFFRLFFNIKCLNSYSKGSK